MIKGVKQRGRLPDMKSNRVTITVMVIGLVVLFFFLVPLPVSRVRDKGLVELQPEHSQKVFLNYDRGGILERVFVEEGDHVEKGQLLAVFTNEDLELQRAKAGHEKMENRSLAATLKQNMSKFVAPEQRKQFEQQIAEAQQKV